MTMKKQARFEYRKVADLKNWDNNPRSILEEDFDRLKGQIETLGVYKTLLVNQDNVVLGGNMRLRAFQKLGIDEIMCGVVETADEGEMLAYALSDNDNAGTTDELKLAELWHLHPIETKLYKVQRSQLRPLEHIINPPDPQGEVAAANTPTTPDGATGNGDMKQIVLYFDTQEYISIMDRIEPLLGKFNCKNTSELFIKMLELAEGHHEDTTSDTI